MFDEILGTFPNESGGSENINEIRELIEYENEQGIQNLLTQDESRINETDDQEKGNEKSVSLFLLDETDMNQEAIELKLKTVQGTEQSTVQLIHQMGFREQVGVFVLTTELGSRQKKKKLTWIISGGVLTWA